MCVCPCRSKLITGLTKLISDSYFPPAQCVRPKPKGVTPGCLLTYGLELAKGSYRMSKQNKLGIRKTDKQKRKKEKKKKTTTTAASNFFFSNQEHTYKVVHASTRKYFTQ